MKQLRPAAGIPPHINYFCPSCEQDFSSAERTPYHDPHNPLAPYYCSVCASVENRRRAA